MSVESKSRNGKHTELVIVRHGEATENVGAQRDGGDGALTERGVRQAELLADRLVSEAMSDGPYDVVYRSSRLRCIQTADIALAPLGLCATTVDELRSLDHGRDGANPWDRHTNLIGTVPPLSPFEAAAEGGETWQECLERSAAALLGLVRAEPGRRILVFAHAETVAGAMHAILGLPVEASRRFYPYVDFTALSVWRHSAPRLPGADPSGQWNLLAHNDGRHLAAPCRVLP